MNIYNRNTVSVHCEFITELRPQSRLRPLTSTSKEVLATGVLLDLRRERPSIHRSEVANAPGKPAIYDNLFARVINGVETHPIDSSDSLPVQSLAGPRGREHRRQEASNDFANVGTIFDISTRRTLPGQSSSKVFYRTADEDGHLDEKGKKKKIKKPRGKKATAVKKSDPKHPWRPYTEEEKDNINRRWDD